MIEIMHDPFGDLYYIICLIKGKDGKSGPGLCYLHEKGKWVPYGAMEIMMSSFDISEKLFETREAAEDYLREFDRAKWLEYVIDQMKAYGIFSGGVAEFDPGWLS